MFGQVRSNDIRDRTRQLYFLSKGHNRVFGNFAGGNRFSEFIIEGSDNNTAMVNRDFDLNDDRPCIH